MNTNKNKETNNEKNWGQVRETVLMINVAVARIEHAMNEGNESVTTLSESFVDIVNAAKQIALAAEKLERSPVKTVIEENCQSISQRMQGAIIAFQFYDKLNQRLSHVSKSLGSLTGILNNSSKINEQKVWLELQNTIRSKYTLDADQQIFNDVLNGMPIEDALKIAQQKTKNNDIELF